MSGITQYHIIVDIGTQWFSYLVVGADDKIKEGYPMPSNLVGPFLKNIYSRPPHFHARCFKNESALCNFDSHVSYYGWSLSAVEYERVKRLIKLRENVDEYEKLLAL